MDKRTKNRFVELYRATLNFSAAARGIGYDRSYTYKVMEQDPDFKAEVLNAEQEALDECEAEALRRAFKGYDKGVWHQGVMVGTEKVYSDSLAALALKAHRPKYKDKSEVTLVDETVPMSDEDKVKKLQALLDKVQSRVDSEDLI
jgi:hypothetical protein